MMLTEAAEERSERQFYGGASKAKIVEEGWMGRGKKRQEDPGADGPFDEFAGFRETLPLDPAYSLFGHPSFAADRRTREEFAMELADTEDPARLLSRYEKRKRRKEKLAARWASELWNPSADLPLEERRIITPEQFAADRSIVLLDPRAILYFAKHPEAMYGLTPRQFETLVAELLERFGYQVTLGPLGRDNGVDVFAERDIGIGPELVLVQCKRYSQEHKVSQATVKQLGADVHDRNATRGLVATTSFFTKPALDYIERSRFRLAGADHAKLRRWLVDLRES